MKCNFFYVGLLFFALILQGCSETQVNNIGGGDNQNNQVKDVIPSIAGDFVNQELAAFAAKRFANRYGFNYSNLLQDQAVKRKSAEKEVAHVLDI